MAYPALEFDLDGVSIRELDLSFVKEDSQGHVPSSGIRSWRHEGSIHPPSQDRVTGQLAIDGRDDSCGEDPGIVESLSGRDEIVVDRRRGHLAIELSKDVLVSKDENENEKRDRSKGHKGMPQICCGDLLRGKLGRSSGRLYRGMVFEFFL
jgi:hypothetical protein